MSNLFKSKFLTGVMVVTVLAIGAFAFTAGVQTASADCSITSTLRLGSTGAQVQCLQTALGGLTVDGSFGPKTKAAVMAWQAKEGLVADGIFGPKSNAVWMANQVNVGVFPAGCTSAVGFSSTTGMSCSGVVMTGGLPAGCTTTSGFSPTTGMSCSVLTGLPAGCSSTAGYSPTTGAKCDSTGVVAPSGTNGYLTDFALDSTSRVSTVYESQQDQVVAGLRGTARLADQTVNRVRVTFVNTNTASSANLAKYISGASLWMGSTRLATMTVAQADRGTSNDVYTFNFSGLSAKVLKDQIGRFYVSVNANGSIDSTDAATANWTVTFLAGGVSASSPDGSFDTYPANDIAQTGLMFGKFSTSGLKATVALASDNPSASVVTVQSNTTATNGVNVLKFTIKAQNSDLTLRKIPIQVVATGNVTSAIINTVKLYKDGNLVDSLDGSNGFTVSGGVITTTPTASANTTGYIFTNLSDPYNKIVSGTSAEYSVVVDLKGTNSNAQFTAGDTLTASLANGDVLSSANFSVQDSNGDQLASNSSVRVGSAVGSVMTLLVNGVNVVMNGSTITTVTDAGLVKQVTYNIPVSVTAIGNTAYFSQTVQDAATVSGTNAFAFVLQDSANPTVDLTTGTLTSTFSCNASLESGSFRLDSGSTKTCNIQVIVTNGPTANHSFRVALKQVKTFAEAALSTGSVQTLLPVESYQTGYQLINQ
jgi:peptidoglycan hydrolase-like protein with peptidoglycan-binding domain